MRIVGEQPARGDQAADDKDETRGLLERAAPGGGRAGRVRWRGLRESAMKQDEILIGV